MATKSKGKAGAGKKGMASSYVFLGLVLIIVLMVGLLCWSGRMKAVAACDPADLKLTAGQQSGAAGTIYQKMTLTNAGTKKCNISGYPTAFLYGNDGYALGSAAAARPQPAAVSINLAPNQSAFTTLGYPQAGNFDPGVCSAKAVALRLYSPGTPTALETPLAVAWCPGFSATAMQPGS